MPATTPPEPQPLESIGGLSFVQDELPFEAVPLGVIWTDEGPMTLVGSVQDVFACIVAYELIQAFAPDDDEAA